MILDRTGIEKLVPHAGTMCLLDEVEAFDATRIVCTSMRHRCQDNPLRRDGRLSVVHAIEFAAQAAAVHGALAVPSLSGSRMGLLVSVRNCRLHVESLDGACDPLRIEARLFATAQSLTSYEFAVSSANVPLADGRLGVFMEAP
jgi:predicted hotdog family 3-hydroxylacyl-ACP dehydratase